MDIEEFNKMVKLAQSYIILFLKDFMSSDELVSIENMFKNCPVVATKIENETSDFGKTTTVGGTASNKEIRIGLNRAGTISIANEYEVNNLLGTLIHEYAHRIRALKNVYGEMLEESFATLFAEACINNARFSLNDDSSNMETFSLLNSIDYQKYESQIRGLLYILKQKGLDKQIIYEYIAGDQEQFKAICVQLFGGEFINYFNTISSTENISSEQMLINIIVHYIEHNGLNIQNYWDNTNSNLYYQGSSTLARAVVKAGPQSFLGMEQSYKDFESIAKYANENDNLIDQEKVDRVKKYIEDKFSLKGKSLEEIYDTIIDLCSAFIQHQNRNDEESKIFISEISKVIPNMNEFQKKFVMLRVERKDMEIFNNLNIENISYADIIASMNSLLEENKNNGMSR